jgi:hypothetical protein
MDRTQAVILAGLVLITGYVAVTVVGAAVDIDAMNDFSDRAETWCDAEGGNLYYANAAGASGGAHCGDIGEHVHMADVAALGWTHDLDAIQRHYQQRTGPLGMFGTATYTVALPAALAIGVVALAIGLLQRWRVQTRS